MLALLAYINRKAELISKYLAYSQPHPPEKRREMKNT